MRISRREVIIPNSHVGETGDHPVIGANRGPRNNRGRWGVAITTRRPQRSAPLTKMLPHSVLLLAYTQPNETHWGDSASLPYFDTIRTDCRRRYRSCGIGGRASRSRRIVWPLEGRCAHPYRDWLGSSVLVTIEALVGKRVDRKRNCGTRIGSVQP